MPKALFFFSVFQRSRKASEEKSGPPSKKKERRYQKVLRPGSKRAVNVTTAPSVFFSAPDLIMSHVECWQVSKTDM
jgi:hypothetical protein